MRPSRPGAWRAGPQLASQRRFWRVHLRALERRVIRAGRTFCRRLTLALSGRALPHHHVRLRVGVREDLRMWVKFLESFNGNPLCGETVNGMCSCSPKRRGRRGLVFIGMDVGVRSSGRVNGKMGVAVLLFWSFFL
ncbi:hypothetical protein NDU88_005625 [Pleurodeles waltl]|uniref:Uncharacterized protein n=1 Tax=Pleurodeles waltl TaxID=8319 RepID=A0AAV7NX54_PLEWA|nr:hypothetical protein NDU88_005625 [Pleurodeles waltl]